MSFGVPIFAPSNVPVYAPSNAPVYASFAGFEWAWMKVKFSWNYSYLPPYHTAHKNMHVCKCGGYVSGTWEYPTYPIDYYLKGHSEWIFEDPALGYDGCITDAYNLNLVDPLNLRCWNESLSRWEVDVFFWSEDTYTPVNHSARIDVEIYTYDRLTLLAQDFWIGTMDYCYDYSERKTESIAVTKRCTVSWHPNSQTLSIS